MLVARGWLQNHSSGAKRDGSLAANKNYSYLTRRMAGSLHPSVPSLSQLIPPIRKSRASGFFYARSTGVVPCRATYPRRQLLNICNAQTPGENFDRIRDLPDRCHRIFCVDSSCVKCLTPC
jgi:hypothetical protein